MQIAVSHVIVCFVTVRDRIESQQKKYRKGVIDMKKYVKRGLAFLLSCTVLLAAGCGEKFDASGYTKAVLDAGTRGETEKYEEFTKSSKEEAKKQYDNFIDTEMQEFESLGVSEELLTKYKEYVASLLKETKYEVGEAKEDEDGNFTVEVSVQPIKVFDGVKDTLNQKVQEYTAQVEQAAMQNQQVPSDQEITETIGQMLYETLNGTLANLSYGEAVKKVVHVKETAEKNVWEIPETEARELFLSLLDMTGVEEIANP